MGPVPDPTKNQEESGRRKEKEQKIRKKNLCIEETRDIMGSQKNLF